MDDRTQPMTRAPLSRRTFAALAGASVAGALHPVTGFAQQGGAGGAALAVPNSDGTTPPHTTAPPGACDCHHHIYDTAFPFTQPSARMVANARVPDYRMLQRRLGITRNIIVTPAPFPASVADNRVTLDALSAFGVNARGVAIVYPAITDAELKTLGDGGITGIRFSLTAADGTSPAIPSTTVGAIEALGKRVNALGWHVQLNIDSTQIVAMEDVLNRLAAPIVFDHMGHMPQPAGTNHPAYRIIRRLIDRGRTWVKLSVTYDSSKIGPPTYADVNKVGEAYVKAAPERMLWGSNWPHPNEINKPDDAVLFDLLADWAPDAATRRRILVENPQVLYGFAKIG